MQIRKMSDIRNNFQDVVDSVHYTKERTIIIKRNKPWAMIVPLQENDPEVIQKIKEYIASLS